MEDRWEGLVWAGVRPRVRPPPLFSGAGFLTSPATAPPLGLKCLSPRHPRSVLCAPPGRQWTCHQHHPIKVHMIEGRHRWPIWPRYPQVAGVAPSIRQEGRGPSRTLPGKGRQTLGVGAGAVCPGALVSPSGALSLRPPEAPPGISCRNREPRTDVRQQVPMDACRAGWAQPHAPTTWIHTENLQLKILFVHERQIQDPSRSRAKTCNAFHKCWIVC